MSIPHSNGVCHAKVVLEVNWASLLAVPATLNFFEVVMLSYQKTPMFKYI